MLRKLLKGLGCILLVGLLILVWQGYLVFFGKPAKVDTMATRQFVQFLLDEPEALTTFGFVDGSYLDFHSDELTPRTQAHIDSRNNMLQRFVAELEKYDRDELPADQALTYDIWSWWMDAQMGASRHFYTRIPRDTCNPYVVSQIGLQSTFARLMTSAHSLSNKKLAENYVSRLRAFGKTADQTIQVFDDHAQRGVLAPRFILDRTLEDIRSLRSSAPESSPLVTNLTAKLEEYDTLPESALAELGDEAAIAVSQAVYPGLDRLAAAIELRLQQARVDQPGVLALPGGRDYYAACLRVQTGSEFDADELHDLGLEEVARLTRQIDAGLVALGYVEGSVGERVDQLRADNRYIQDDTDKSHAQLLTIAEQLIRGSERAMQPYFDTFPKTPVIVRPIPAYLSNSANNSYSRPSADGRRPGYYNVHLSSKTTAVNLPSLTYHEAVPGHHFQLARFVESGLPVLRRNLPFVSFVEGWALYAERLASEVGMYEDDPVGLIGARVSELFRAARLVVDTGLHHKGWDRDEAVDYFSSVLYSNPEFWSREVDRYTVRPGQALAYKVGQLEILDLRARAQARLEDKFDLAEFHEQILKDGPMPWAVMDTKINDWLDGVDP